MVQKVGSIPKPIAGTQQAGGGGRNLTKTPGLFHRLFYHPMIPPSETGNREKGRSPMGWNGSGFTRTIIKPLILILLI